MSNLNSFLSLYISNFYGMLWFSFVKTPIILFMLAFFTYNHYFGLSDTSEAVNFMSASIGKVFAISLGVFIAAQISLALDFYHGQVQNTSVRPNCSNVDKGKND